MTTIKTLLITAIAVSAITTHAMADGKKAIKARQGIMYICA